MQWTARTAAMTRLVVAIPTFKRPERLAELLPMAGEQLAALRASGLVTDAAMFVVDNDGGESARSVVAVVVRGLPGTLRRREDPGIPAVRNRRCRRVERLPAARVHRRRRAAAAGLARVARAHVAGDRAAGGGHGRVVSIFAEDVDPWVTASGLFQRPQRADRHRDLRRGDRQPPSRPRPGPRERGPVRRVDRSRRRLRHALQQGAQAHRGPVGLVQRVGRRRHGRDRTSDASVGAQARVQPRQRRRHGAAPKLESGAPRRRRSASRGFIGGVARSSSAVCAQRVRLAGPLRCGTASAGCGWRTAAPG